MSADNDRIRRQLGAEMPGAPRKMADMAFSVRALPDRPKQSDEWPRLDPELLKSIVLGCAAVNV